MILFLMEYVTNEWASSKPGLATFCAMEQENLASWKKKKSKSSKGRETGGNWEGRNLEWIYYLGFWIQPCLNLSFEVSIKSLHKLPFKIKFLIKEKMAQRSPGCTNTR